MTVFICMHIFGAVACIQERKKQKRDGIAVKRDQDLIVIGVVVLVEAIGGTLSGTALLFFCSNSSDEYERTF
jgi:hypothetical protein